MKIAINTAFDIKDTVYLKVNSEFVGTVVNIDISIALNSQSIVYIVSWQDRETTDHFEFELTDEKDYKDGK